MKKAPVALLTALLALALTAGSAMAAKVIKVGASPTPPAEILTVAAEELKAKG